MQGVRGRVRLGDPGDHKMLVLRREDVEQRVVTLEPRQSYFKSMLVLPVVSKARVRIGVAEVSCTLVF